MLRHSRSLLVSLAVHALLVTGLFISYKSLVSAESSEKSKERICVSLCCLSEVKKDKKEALPKTSKQENKTQRIKPSKNNSPVKQHSSKVQKIASVQKNKIPIPEELILLDEIIEQKEIKKAPSKQVEPLKSKEKAEEVKVTSSETVSMPLNKEEQTKNITPKQAYLDENVDHIVKLLQENLYYPRSARRRGIEGEVIVAFTLTKDAEVKSLKVLSSEHDILSRGAIETIGSLSGKFPKPKEKLELSVPISYSLRR